MNVFIAGASGFVGERIIEHLAKNGHSITALVRSSKEGEQLRSHFSDIETMVGDVTKPESLKLPAQTEAIVYLPGILREDPSKGITFQKIHVDGVRNVLNAAKKTNASRWLQMSALGADTAPRTGYFATKLQGETLVKTSTLQWTILRPSVVAPDRPTKQFNFVGQLADVIKKSPVVPIFGKGLFRLQPIALDDVARIYTMALENENTIGKTIELAGPDKLAYRDILEKIARALGKKRMFLSIPLPIIKAAIALLGRFSFFPITNDQLVMLLSENIIKDPAREKESMRLFPFERTTFDTALAHSIRANKEDS